MKERVVRGNLYLGTVLLICASLFLFGGSQFMKTWYYIFAWWSFILILDSINFRRAGSSPLFESLSNFLFMSFLSVCVWLIFELFNLRLKNWSYFDLPTSRFLRWLGFSLAFATVFPALKELSLLFQGLLSPRLHRLFRIRITASLLRSCVCFGILSVALPLIWPRLFFPLVWLSLIFLVEPVNYWRRAPTLISDLHRNDWRKFWSWVLAGLAAGFLWEFWNFWADSRWEYSLPYLDFWRIFQMPVFGYLGFLPFALEIFAIQNLLSSIQNRVKKKPAVAVLLFIALLLFCLAGFHLIDQFSVIF